MLRQSIHFMVLLALSGCASLSTKSERIKPGQTMDWKNRFNILAIGFDEAGIVREIKD